MLFWSMTSVSEVLPGRGGHAGPETERCEGGTVRRDGFDRLATVRF